VGTGKYASWEQARDAIEASGSQMVTMAVRRTNLGQNPDEPSLLDIVSPEKYTLLPNTAGCYNAKDAVRTCKLARELLDGHNLVKLEVLGDEKTLYPDVTETLKAAEQLIDEGFRVMVYTNDDPLIALKLERMGCIAVMPLGAPSAPASASRTATTSARSWRTPTYPSWWMPAWERHRTPA